MSTRCIGPRRRRGFTVLELLVTMTVTSILSAIAVPTLSGLVLDTRRTVMLNDLVATVQMARSTASVRGRTVVACPSRDGATCTTPDGWATGWIVFVDLDGEPAARSPEEPLLRAFQAGKNLTVRVNLSGAGETLQLRPLHHRSTNGTITVCDARGAHEARAVFVGVMGRPYVSSKAADGQPLTC